MTCSVGDEVATVGAFSDVGWGWNCTCLRLLCFLSSPPPPAAIPQTHLVVLFSGLSEAGGRGETAIKRGSLQK